MNFLQKSKRVVRCPLSLGLSSIERMMLPALFCIFTLAIVGCSGIEVTTPRSNPSGLYVEEDEFDLSNLVGTEEIQLLQDGTGVSRRKFGATSPAIRVLRDSRIRLTTTRESGNKVYVLEFKGKWKLRGDKIFYQDDKARIDHIGDFFLAVFNPKEPRSSLSARHVFSIDSNGDLLRIPPRGHPYYAGKFVKQK